PYWQGKLLILSLIGFAATGFIITITLSAADAAAHVVENPLVPHALHNAQLPITLLLVLLLGAVFLKGFTEAIGIAVAIVIAYIGLNLMVVGRGLMEVVQHPDVLGGWRTALTAQHPTTAGMIVAAVLVFPQLALGLSGFETGVVVMPLVKGDPGDDPEQPAGRIRNAGRLLATAAAVMSVLLVSSSVATTCLIPVGEFQPRLAGSAVVSGEDLVRGVEVGIRPEGDVPDPAKDVRVPVPAIPVATETSLDFKATTERIGAVSAKAGIVQVGADRFRVDVVKEAGNANGRALAWMAHKYFGDSLGTVYDAVTVLILWFAGASAMAGLLNIVPRYLPRYGMAPEWSRAIRPLVLIFTGLCLLVTVLFDADVDAQAGAYATGVLALMTSATIAVTLAALRTREKVALVGYGIVTVVFVYALAVNVWTQPEGLRISLLFIFAILAVSTISRLWRTTELRVDAVEFDEAAVRMLETMATQSEVRFIANHPDEEDASEYTKLARTAAWRHHFPEQERWAFVEVYVQDASSFSSTLRVEGLDVDGFWVLRCHGVAVPNAIAALLLEVRRRTNRQPHVYFQWIEASPLRFLAKFFLTGQGDVAPLTHEVLRRAEQDPGKRPVVHAAG
ncbi:MAG: APC family permease, partial [Armatimonadota bacterium]